MNEEDGEEGSRMRASFKLFDNLKCCSKELKGNFDNEDAALALVDEDMMRCHILNCLAALNLVQVHKEKKTAVADNEKYQVVKRKVFDASIAMIINDEFESNQAVVDIILSAFPNEKKMHDKRS